MYTRGRFGIEYDARRRDRRDPPVVHAILAAAFLAALVSMSVRCYRMRGGNTNALRDSGGDAPAAAVVSRAASQPSNAPPRRVAVAASAALPASTPKGRSLTLRLAEAERRNDLEMAVSTLEAILKLANDAEVRRRFPHYIDCLGRLNVQRLFERRSALWVSEVTVKRGDNATRIVREHGSTLASLKRLNPQVDIDRLKIGQRVFVMEHPRVVLEVSVRSKSAALMLNGKLFKAYRLSEEPIARDGEHVLPERPGTLWNELGIRFKDADRSEVEALMTTGSKVTFVREEP